MVQYARWHMGANVLGTVSLRVAGSAFAGPAVPPAGVVECTAGGAPTGPASEGTVSTPAGPAGVSTGPVGGGLDPTDGAGTGMLVRVFQRPEKVWVTSVCTAAVVSGSTACEDNADRIESRACSRAALGAGVGPLCAAGVCEASSARMRRTSAPAWLTASDAAWILGVSKVS
eukprot:2438353-Amphidinium_carterae.1